MSSRSAFLCDRWQGGAGGEAMTLGSRLNIRSFAASPRFLALAGAEQDAETFLAGARVFLALGSSLATALDPSFPARFAVAAYVLLFLYLIHSFLALVSGRYRRRWMSGPKLHTIDVLWVACIPVFIQGANGAFFLLYPFLLFALLAAAYRWGLYETLATAVACTGLLVIGNLLTAPAGPLDLHASFARLGFKDIAERAAALFMTACVVGYLGGQERDFRAKASILARFTSKVLS